MNVRVRLFAGTRDAVGAPSVEIEVPEGALVDDAITLLCARHPRLAAYRPHALVALDGAFVAGSAPLRAGAELALMPPVSGGSGALQAEPFGLDALAAELARAGAGAIVAFVGVVRGDEGVSRLAFEAYAEMAEREIEAVRAEAVAKFGLLGCLVRHRLGVLAVGEPIVAVATSAAHRRAAFEGAAWVMDELKTRVPIWKQEQGPSVERWVNDPTSE
jgi:molybdopterin synthase catalytic subunit